MLKKLIKITGIIFLTGFSFFYTEKVTKIVRNKDPIMIKINEIKKDSYINVVKPIINNDEYITGINGCTIDIDKSYNKMKQVGEFKEELIVMKETNENNIKGKYIVGANKLSKKISLVFYIKDDINNDLINFLSNKNITGNFFIDHDYLEKNIITIRFISENNNNIYYLGKNNIYEDKYMIYINNLIGINTNNESNLCITDKKDSELLKLCSNYDMKTIKTTPITDNIISNVKENLTNGAIISIDSSDTDKIKVAINYILSKGYKIVSLDELLNENVNCMK